MERNKKDFSHYCFEDFLSDDYFIDSMKNPDDVEFWEEFQRGDSENLTEYLYAKLYMKSIPVNRDALSEDEVSVLWNSIQKSARESLFYVKRRRRLLMIGIGMAAACIIGILSVPLFLEMSSSTGTEIYSFVSRNQKTDFDSSSSRLILSEDKTVLLDGKESIVVYNSANIEVNGGENLFRKESSAYNQLIVPRGKRSVLTLSDGTKVWVNAGTRLVFPVEFKKKERELYVDGEIYIQVAHNQDWPFVVKTKDICINVLGTEFNVTAHESEEIKRVVLASGSIGITGKNEDKGILLSPDKMYQYNDDEGIVEDVDASKYISWKDDLYIFENEKLSIIFDRLSRHYGENIEFESEAGDMRCSGKLDLRINVNDILKGLTSTAPITYEKYDDTFFIRKKP